MPDSTPAAFESVDHLFISPHFDDAVFSCGGTIHRLTRAGSRVTVITVMGGKHNGDLPRSPILDDLHSRWAAGDDPLRARQTEDFNALRQLNANPIHLDLTDCVYRCVAGKPLYPTEESLFGAVHPADYAPAFLDSMPRADIENAAVIWLPLGVGNHVDHQIIRDWGLRRLANQGDRERLRWYAEFPYFADESAIIHAFGAFDAMLFQCHINLDAADFAARLQAMSCYESQLSTFWRDHDHMATETSQAARLPGTDILAERYWQLA